MIATRVLLNSATTSAWIPVDWRQAPFALEIACVCSSNINATYKVQYTVDPYVPINCTITRSTTTATLTTPSVTGGHGLTTNDSIIVIGSGDTNLDGTFTPASISSQTVLTYTVSNTGATAGASTSSYIPLRVFDHSTITGKIANFDGNLTVPVTAVRLNITSYTAGYVTMILRQGTR